MIFLKKLSLRQVKFKRLTGGISVWMALCFLVFLSLYQICLKSVWKQLQRQRAVQAAESGVFSLLSEYEPHLLEDYDLFFLDTSFRSGKEQTRELCSHLWYFMNLNLQDSQGNPVYGMKMKGVDIEGLIRATDGGGMVFYRQAIRMMKERTGFSLAEDWILQDKSQQDMEEQKERFQKDSAYYEGSVVDYDDEEEEIEKEAREWDGLYNSFTLSMAIPEGRELSSRSISMDWIPSHRSLSEGVGKADGTENDLVEKQWFISYLCEYLRHAQEMLPEQREGGYLDYQLEYVIGGNASDQENLDHVIREILLIREGVNYTFLLRHPEYVEKAEILSVLLVGITGNEALIKSVKHLILLGWAYGESLVEMRQLLNGFELSAVKGEEDWQVSLAGVLSLISNPGGYDEQRKRQEGISYETYLRILLMLKKPEMLAMRALDVIEGELRAQPGCGNIHMDHCVEGMTVRIWLDGIYMERLAAYE